MFKLIRTGAGQRSVRNIAFVVATAALVVSWSSTPRTISGENAAMEWNRIALAATVTANQGPLPQSRSMTIVQVSVHDAVNAITGKHSTYLSHGAAPAGASADAAAIAAAHRVLVRLVLAAVVRRRARPLRSRLGV